VRAGGGARFALWGATRGGKGSGPLLATTVERLVGYRAVPTLGEVLGVVIRSRSVGGTLVAAVRSPVGRELRECTPPA
jgi:hypothetical protein